MIPSLVGGFEAGTTQTFGGVTVTTTAAGTAVAIKQKTCPFGYQESCPRRKNYEVNYRGRCCSYSFNPPTPPPCPSGYSRYCSRRANYDIIYSGKCCSYSFNPPTPPPCPSGYERSCSRRANYEISYSGGCCKYNYSPPVTTPSPNDWTKDYGTDGKFTELKIDGKK